MNINNPDLARQMKQQVASSMRLFGETVDWRKYISSSGSYPEFGQLDTPKYTVRQSMWQLKGLKLDELQMPGGEIYAAAYEVFTQDPINARDEMRYNGKIYRCVSQPAVQSIGTTLWYQAIFALAQPTGRY